MSSYGIRLTKDEIFHDQSWPFKARDPAHVPSDAPCFVEVRDKHAPSKIVTLLRAHLEIELFVRKEELFCFSFLNNLIK